MSRSYLWLRLRSTAPQPTTGQRVPPSVQDTWVGKDLIGSTASGPRLPCGWARRQGLDQRREQSDGGLGVYSRTATAPTWKTYRRAGAVLHCYPIRFHVQGGKSRRLIERANNEHQVAISSAKGGIAYYSNRHATACGLRTRLSSRRQVDVHKRVGDVTCPGSGPRTCVRSPPCLRKAERQAFQALAATEAVASLATEYDDASTPVKVQELVTRLEADVGFRCARRAADRQYHHRARLRRFPWSGSERSGAMGH